MTAGLMAGLASKENSSNHFGPGKPGLARLLSALAASSFLLGLVSATAAAAAATTLGAARALAALAGGPRRVRDRRRPRLVHSLLPQTFASLVVLDTWSMIFYHCVLLASNTRFHRREHPYRAC